MNTNQLKIAIPMLVHRRKEWHILLAFLMLTVGLKAQDTLVHTGENIYVSPTENLYIFGTYKSITNSNPLAPANLIKNDGIIHIQGDIINNGTQNIFGVLPTAGTLEYFGRKALHPAITGTNPIHLNHFSINLADTLDSGYVSLKTSLVSCFGNVSFVSGGLELANNVFSLSYITGNQGILMESNAARPFVKTENPDGRISLFNYAIASGSTQTNIQGLGLGFRLNQSLGLGSGGAIPVLTRTFQTQACGDSVGHPGSIQRAFRVTGNANPASFSNVKIKYLNPSELAGNTPADSMHLFVSLDKGLSWNQHLNSSGSANQISSTETTIFSVPGTGSGAPLNYTVVTAASPCSFVAPIQINQILTGISPNDTLFNIDTVIACDPQSVSARLFATGEPGAKFEWRLAGSNTYLDQNGPGFFDLNALGTYWVRMTNSRGCVDSSFVNVIISPPGNSAINALATQVCFGDTVRPSPVIFDNTFTYLWNFGDSTTSVLPFPAHRYASYGNKSITLKVTTSEGCVSSSVKSITVNSPLTAAFTVNSACAGTNLVFTNASTLVFPSLSLVSLHWNFGAGDTAASSYYNSGLLSDGDVNHTFLTAGDKIVSLVAKSNGCTSPTFTDTIKVYPIPNAAFSVGPTCSGKVVNFSNNSTISDASPMTYFWDFTGAGPTSTDSLPVGFSYPPNFTNPSPTLIAYSNKGCSDTVTQTITINANPQVDFSLVPACINSPASFADNTLQGTLPYSYLWNFGDGTSSVLANDTNVYAVAATYPVLLTVTDSNGCVGAKTKNITIFPGPSVSFTASNACVGSSIQFLNTSTNAVSYAWDFYTFGSSTVPSPSQIFNVAGTYPVKLEATSSNSCKGTRLDSITIYPLPLVNLGDTVGTCGSSYLLQIDTTGINSGSTFLWSNGANTFNYLVNFNGTFGVTVTSQLGCQSRDTVVVKLNSAVVPQLGPALATFCDSTVLNAGYPGASYLWSTGDTTQTISVSSSGLYKVTVTDQNNCVGQDSIQVTIVPGIPVSLGSDTAACASSGVLLNAGIATNYSWTKAGSATVLSILPTFQVPTSGIYIVNVGNAAGCSSTDTIQVTLYTSPAQVLGPDVTACQQIVINAFSSANYYYVWNTGVSNASITVQTSGSYIVTITDLATTCSTLDSINVVINPLPVVNLGADTSLCSYQTFTIDAGNAGAGFLWNSGQSTQTINIAAQGVYEVTVTDANGCVNTDQILVQFRPVFTIELGPDRQFCPGSTLQLDAGLTTSGNTYLWQSSNSILGTGATYTVADTGLHYLTVTNSFQCVAKDSITVIPSNNSLFASFLADSEIDKGDTLQLVNLSHPRPYASKWYLDNILVTTDSTPSIAFNMPVNPPIDTVFATLKVSNAYCTSVLTKPIIVNSGLKPLPEPEPEPIPSLYSEIKYMNLYPNPNNGLFYLNIDINKESFIRISVFNITGELLYTENRTMTTGIIPYNFEQLSPGMYFFSVELYKERRTLKFIKTPY